MKRKVNNLFFLIGISFLITVGFVSCETQPQVFNLSFEENGGSTVTSKLVTENESTSKPEDPIKVGYFFKGWYEESALTTEWDFDTPITVDKTLYAKWNLNSYMLSFNTGGGIDIYDQTISHEEKATKPDTPTKDGHTFESWYKDDAFTNAWDFNTDTVKQETTLYAKWNVNNYILSFNTNVEGNIDPQSILYNTTATKPTDPTKDHHSLEGWYSDDSFTTEWNFDTDKVTQNITLYAKWNLNSYMLSFNTDGGSDISSQSIPHDNTAIKPDNPTKEGHTFASWYKESSLTTEWDFNTDTVKQDITLYAKWTVNNYALSFETNGGSPISQQTIVYNTPLAKPEDPIKEGYALEGWYKDDSLKVKWDFDLDTVKQDLTLYAKWLYLYTVSFDARGGSPIDPVVVMNGEKIQMPENPIKAGFVFEGWFKETAFINLWNFDSEKVTYYRTLYAKYRERTVGDRGPSGGYIFYDDEADGYDDIPGYRYLEAAPEGWYTGETDSNGDYNLENGDPSFQWGAYPNLAEAPDKWIGAGKNNTDVIVNYHNSLGQNNPDRGDYYTNSTAYDENSDGTVAAKESQVYSILIGSETYNDWFLPSKDELQLMYEFLHKQGLGGFSNTSYWSSSEDRYTSAYSRNFGDGSSHNYKSKYFDFKIRPVRAFN